MARFRGSDVGEARGRAGPEPSPRDPSNRRARQNSSRKRQVSSKCEPSRPTSEKEPVERPSALHSRSALVDLLVGPAPAPTNSPGKAGCARRAQDVETSFVNFPKQLDLESMRGARTGRGGLPEGEASAIGHSVGDHDVPKDELEGTREPEPRPAHPGRPCPPTKHPVTHAMRCPSRLCTIAEHIACIAIR